MRVKVSETGMYTYPDVVGLCDQLRLEDGYADTLLNPAVIIEVLSESTERYDRCDKFAHYLYRAHEQPRSEWNAEQTRQRVQEAQLFIEAAHACVERMDKANAQAQAAPAAPAAPPPAE